MALSTEVWKYAPWSYSKMSDALNCSLLFHKKHVTRETGVAEDRTAMLVGNAVHTVLEHIAMGRTPAEALHFIQNSDNILYEVKAEVKSFRDGVKDFDVRLRSYKQRYGVTTSNTWIEKRIAVNGDFKLCNYGSKEALFRGKADLILLTRGRNGVVFDHKTGQPGPLDRYTTQLKAYAVMLDAAAEVLQISSAIHFVGTASSVSNARLLWGPTYPVETIRSVLRKELCETLERAVANVQNPQPTQSWLCKYCDYKSVCPLHK